MQLDIAFDDVVFPTIEESAYPSLLGYPAPMLRMYPRETVVAEKFQAMVALVHYSGSQATIVPSFTDWHNWRFSMSSFKRSQRKYVKKAYRVRNWRRLRGGLAQSSEPHGLDCTHLMASSRTGMRPG